MYSAGFCVYFSFQTSKSRLCKQSMCCAPNEASTTSRRFEAASWWTAAVELQPKQLAHGKSKYHSSDRNSEDTEDLKQFSIIMQWPQFSEETKVRHYGSYPFPQRQAVN